MAKKAKHEIKKQRQLVSAAAALGGKMSTTVVRMPITNVYVDGEYTGPHIRRESERPANVLLDTGSSSLAVDGDFYDATTDAAAHITNIAQEVPYADGSSWIGGIVKTDVVIGKGKQIVTLLRGQCGGRLTMKLAKCSGTHRGFWDSRTRG